MKRLNQLVTRLIILALVAMAVWVGREYLGKQAMVYHLQSYIGARVDAKNLRISSDDSNVFLNQVEIANPLDDRQNLLQFEAASLKLDFEQLKDRRVVIESGRLSEIKFAATRTTSGKLERGIFDAAFSRSASANFDEQSFGFPQPATGVIRETASYPIGQRWRDSVMVDVGRASGAAAKDSFEVGPMLAQKTQQWVNRFSEPNKQMVAVSKSLSKVEKLLSIPVEEQNPLRSGTRIEDAVAEIKTSLETLEQVGQLIPQLESRSQEDLYELSQIQMRDRQSLVGKNVTQKFDRKLVNELLVGEVQRQLVTNGVQWFQQFRNSLPDPKTDFRPIVRGRDVMFGKMKKPNLEIKKLEIDGAAEFANSHFNFAGTVENISDDTTNSETPLKFSLRAQGDPQVIVSGSIDRTAKRSADTIVFTGHAIPQPAYTLGSRDSIQISMSGNSRLHVDAELHADQYDRISGSITFTFEDVMLHADSVHAVAGGAETAARLNETVSGIDSFRVVSTLGGTVAQPTTAFVSDLGQRVSESLESVFEDAQQLASRKREHQLNKMLDGELVQFKDGVTNSIAKLNESWRASYSRLNQLKKKISVAQGPRFTRPSTRR